jgi:DnaJ-class molecular chaperone
MNPYLVLDLPLDAGDADVRAAYQELLRRYSPERRPEQFQIIQEAYEKLRTAHDRWQWRLLHLKDEGSGPLDALENFARLPGGMRPPGAAEFHKFLKACGNAAARSSLKR